MSLLLRAITKEFEISGSAPHVAVADVTLEIEGNRFYALLGPSGCGKTTLLRLIAGFEQPTRGEIVHHGRPLNGVAPYRRGFPMVFQSYALFPHMSVRENVGYGLRLRKLSRAERAERVERALLLLGLQPQRDRYPAQLSGGQQQRVALARALVLEPEIILLDEPLSNLDAELRVAMRSEIRALQRRLGITAVHVTHDQEEAIAIADQVVVMNAGRVEQIGSPLDIVQRPRTAFVARFMGCPNILPVERPAADRVLLLGQVYECRGCDPAARHVVIRSDAVALSRTHGRHAAVIEEATFLGSRYRYVLRGAEGDRLAVERPWSTDAAATFTSGDHVCFDILPDRLHFL
jgi:ABC-type Fe3+/spermidine/putrescine transport system ATPase subunit